MRLKFFTFCCLSILFIACKVSPDPIVYGQDACQFCSMTIVDQQHASQLVTSKGKQYKFDAIECTLNYLSEHQDIEIAYNLVADYNTPGHMTDALSATYLICEEIKSPMGANLTAFELEDVASKTQKKLGGELLKWPELKARFNAE